MIVHQKTDEICMRQLILSLSKAYGEISHLNRVHDSGDMLSRAAKVVIKYLVREEIEK